MTREEALDRAIAALREVDLNRLAGIDATCTLAEAWLHVYDRLTACRS